MSLSSRAAASRVSGPSGGGRVSENDLLPPCLDLVRARITIIKIITNAKAIQNSGFIQMFEAC